MNNVNRYVQIQKIGEPNNLKVFERYYTTEDCLVVRNCVRRVRRYQMGNQKPNIEEEQTTQWSKEKGQKDKQRSTKHTNKTKDRVTRIPLKTSGELRCSGRVNSSRSTSGTRRVYLVTNPLVSRQCVIFLI